MQCLEAEAVLSALHDGETVTDAEAAAARAHCASCRSCDAFESALGQFDHVSSHDLPEGLVERIVAAATAEAQAASQRVPVAEMSTPTAIEPAAPARRGQAFWMRVGAVAAVAASVLVVAIVGTEMRGANVASTANEARSATAPGATVGSGTGNGARGSVSAGEAAKNAVAAAPSYVSYSGAVYIAGATVTGTSTIGDSVGTLVSAFASPTDTPVTASVFRAPASSDGSIAVRTPEGLRLFVPVVRVVNGVRYQLQTGAPIDRYGAWPTLPSGVTAPTAADGSPTFARAATDANGVSVYALTGYTIGRGLAVAPLTSSSDPAAGDPNWTWWTPLP